MPRVPFEHQVSGHGQLITLDSDKICKPLVETENRFYESASKSKLASFLPKYFGVVTITFDKDQPTAQLNSSCDDNSSNSSNTNSNGIGDNTRWIDKTRDRLETTQSETLNAWKDQPIRKYIILEDLTHGMKRPSVLDIKLGARAHGFDAPPEKARIQIEKSAATTSGALALRLCGMQIYRSDLQDYQRKDKMLGRKVTTENFRANLMTYFFNGIQYRTDVMRVVLREVRAMRSFFETQTEYLLLSASLLIVYEGDTTIANNGCDGDSSNGVTDEQEKRNVVVKLVDFAHGYSQEVIREYAETAATETMRADARSYLGKRDESLLFGLQNLEKILETAIAEVEQTQ